MIDIEAIRERLDAITPGPLLDKRGRPILRDWCCVVCGAWTPHNHPEAHDHKDDCEAFKAESEHLKARATHYAAAATDIACLLAEIVRLTAALATAKDEERAAVVAWLRGEAHFTDVGPLDTFADAYADVIESGRHREIRT